MSKPSRTTDKVDPAEQGVPPPTKPDGRSPPKYPDSTMPPAILPAGETPAGQGAELPAIAPQAPDDAHPGPWPLEEE